MTRLITLAIAAALVISIASPTRADDAETMKTLDEMLAKYEMLFNKHDAKALAEFYALKVNVKYAGGKQINTRKEMEKSFAEHFEKNPDVRTEFTDVTRTVVTPRVVVESAKWKESGHTEQGLPTEGEYSCVLMKRKDKWLIVHDRAWAKSKEAKD